MQLANQEAQHCNVDYIGTEHILTGVLKADGVAVRVLHALQIDTGSLLTQIRSLMFHGQEMVVMGKLPQTQLARKVIENAVYAARDMHNNYIGTEHLLIALASAANADNSMTEGLAYAVLSSHGLTRDKVMEATRQQLGISESETPKDKFRPNLTIEASHCRWVMTFSDSLPAASIEYKVVKEDGWHTSEHQPSGMWTVDPLELVRQNDPRIAHITHRGTIQASPGMKAPGAETPVPEIQVAEGFIRLWSEYKVSEDGTSLTYTIIDVKPLVDGLLRCEGYSPLAGLYKKFDESRLLDESRLGKEPEEAKEVKPPPTNRGYEFL